MRRDWPCDQHGMPQAGSKAGRVRSFAQPTGYMSKYTARRMPPRSVFTVAADSTSQLEPLLAPLSRPGLLGKQGRAKKLRLDHAHDTPTGPPGDALICAWVHGCGWRIERGLNKKEEQGDVPVSFRRASLPPFPMRVVSQATLMGGGHCHVPRWALQPVAVCVSLGGGSSSCGVAGLIGAGFTDTGRHETTKEGVPGVGSCLIALGRCDGGSSSGASRPAGCQISTQGGLPGWRVDSREGRWHPCNARTG